jgi:hypothetical protein
MEPNNLARESKEKEEQGAGKQRSERGQNGANYILREDSSVSGSVAGSNLGTISAKRTKRHRD